MYPSILRRLTNLIFYTYKNSCCQRIVAVGKITLVAFSTLFYDLLYQFFFSETLSAFLLK